MTLTKTTNIISVMNEWMNVQYDIFKDLWCMHNDHLIQLHSNIITSNIQTWLCMIFSERHFHMHRTMFWKRCICILYLFFSASQFPLSNCSLYFPLPVYCYSLCKTVTDLSVGVCWQWAIVETAVLAADQAE